MTSTGGYRTICRRTGKTCILMDQPLAAQPVQPPSVVVLHWGHTDERQAADKAL